MYGSGSKGGDEVTPSEALQEAVRVFVSLDDDQRVQVLKMLEDRVIASKPVMQQCGSCGDPLSFSPNYPNRAYCCEREECQKPCCDCCSEVYADGKRYCQKCTAPE